MNTGTNRKLVAIKYLINDILQGATSSVMIDKLRNDDYNIGYKYSFRSSQEILSLARKRIKEDTDEMLPTLKNDMIARALDVYTECREVGDRLGALKSLEQINKICGLYLERKEVDAKIAQSITIEFGIEDDNNEDENEDE